MNLQDVIKAWNEQADEHNQWDMLGGDEMVEFALKYTEENIMTDGTPGDGIADEDCGKCYRCLEGKVTKEGMPVWMTIMITCPQCGNKRCPKATDHRLECSGSNDPGQEGSLYE